MRDFFAVGNEELENQPEIKKGDEIDCPHCPGKHVISCELLSHECDSFRLHRGLRDRGLASPAPSCVPSSGSRPGSRGRGRNCTGPNHALRFVSDVARSVLVSVVNRTAMRAGPEPNRQSDTPHGLKPSGFSGYARPSGSPR